MAHLLKSYIYFQECAFVCTFYKPNISNLFFYMVRCMYTVHTIVKKKKTKKISFSYVRSKSFCHLSRMRKSNNVTHFPRDLIHNIKSVSTCEFPKKIFSIFPAKMVSWLRELFYIFVHYCGIREMAIIYAIKYNLDRC